MKRLLLSIALLATVIGTVNLINYLMLTPADDILPTVPPADEISTDSQPTDTVPNVL
ncbi:MAG: hypothetical protein K2M76_06720 [Muribaculaceae bacterium]|nr:hypothetical protein [Muribaculaceae bacterium]